MALENLQSVFSIGSGNSNSQIGGRHGGTEGNQPPHPDEHSNLDNIVGNTPIPEKPTPELNEFGATGEKTTPTLGISPEIPLDSFPKTSTILLLRSEFSI